MNKIVEMNTSMKKVLSSKNNFSFFRANRKKIQSEIVSFFDRVKIYEYNGEKCFSAENCFDTDININSLKNISTLIDWEWDTNEIYLDKSIIGKEFKRAIFIALETIELCIVERFPNITFRISLSLQTGKFRNINARIYLDRGVPYTESDIEGYNQAILNETYCFYVSSGSE